MLKLFGKKLKQLFSSRKLDEKFYEELEDTLIEGDMGAMLSMQISDEIRNLAKNERPRTVEELQAKVREMLDDKVSHYDPAVDRDNLNIFLILGVNGVGKTTSIAKLATLYQKEGHKVLMAAADTFRAAAIDQLELHAERTGCRIVKQKPGSDPGAVIFDAITSAQSRGENLILADTAGRMHNKENLLRELMKIDKVIRMKGIDDDHYKKFLVIDSTTGQNGLSQAEYFHKAVGLDGIILTKYDSLAKGGALVQIGEKLGLPICFVGTGEGYEDMHRFDKDEFISSLVGMDD